MAIYKVKGFARFARKHRIDDGALASAARAVHEGRHDADLGGGLYKQRVARRGGGKSAGFRTLIVRRTSEHLFFVYGFPKSARSNIALDEVKALKAMGRQLGLLSQEALVRAVVAGELEVVFDGDAQEDDTQGSRRREP